jgi:hypothetical protein
VSSFPFPLPHFTASTLAHTANRSFDQFQWSCEAISREVGGGWRLSWPGLPVRISLPLLVVAVGVPHLYSLTFAGTRSLPHSLACIGLRPCWPGPSLLVPSFTLACQLHRHSHPPTHLALASICAHLSSYVSTKWVWPVIFRMTSADGHFGSFIHHW